MKKFSTLLIAVFLLACNQQFWHKTCDFSKFDNYKGGKCNTCDAAPENNWPSDPLTGLPELVKFNQGIYVFEVWQSDTTINGVDYDNRWYGPFRSNHIQRWKCGDEPCLNDCESDCRDALANMPELQNDREAKEEWLQNCWNECNSDCSKRGCEEECADQPLLKRANCQKECKKYCKDQKIKWRIYLAFIDDKRVFYFAEDVIPNGKRDKVLDKQRKLFASAKGEPENMRGLVPPDYDEVLLKIGLNYEKYFYSMRGYYNVEVEDRGDGRESVMVHMELEKANSARKKASRNLDLSFKYSGNTLRLQEAKLVDYRHGQPEDRFYRMIEPDSAFTFTPVFKIEKPRVHLYLEDENGEWFYIDRIDRSDQTNEVKYLFREPIDGKTGITERLCSSECRTW